MHYHNQQAFPFVSELLRAALTKLGFQILPGIRLYRRCGVATCLVSHHRHPLREAARRDGFLELLLATADRGDHHGPRVAPQAVAKCCRHH